MKTRRDRHSEAGVAPFDDERIKELEGQSEWSKIPATVAYNTLLLAGHRRMRADIKVSRLSVPDQRCVTLLGSLYQLIDPEAGHRLLKWMSKKIQTHFDTHFPATAPSSGTRSILSNTSETSQPSLDDEAFPALKSDPVGAGNQPTRSSDTSMHGPGSSSATTRHTDTPIWVKVGAYESESREAPRSKAVLRPKKRE